MTEGPKLKRTLPGLLMLMLLVVAVYSRSLPGGFILDDAIILGNENVTDPARWMHFLKLDGLRPLTYLTFHLNYRWSGADPMPYHAVNLILHLLNGLLVFSCLLNVARSVRFTSAMKPAGADGRILSEFAALMGTAFFVLHPLQTEAVNYVYQRSTLLAAFFGLAGLWLLQRRPTSTLSISWSVILFMAAVLSKETAIVWPLAYLLVMAFVGRKLGKPSRLMKKAHLLRCADPAQGGISRAPRLWELFDQAEVVVLPHPARRATCIAAGAVLLLMAVVGAWVFWKLRASGEETLAFGSAHNAFSYLWTQCHVVLKYLILVLIPWGQNVDHDIRPASHLDFSTAWPIVALLFAVIGSMLAAWRGHLMGLGGVLVVLFLLPTSSIVPSDDLMFEHRMYLPMLGIALLVAGAAGSIFTRTQRYGNWRWILPVILCVYLVPWTWARNNLWSDPIALWKDAAAKSPQKARPRVVLGTLLLQKDTQAAISSLERALTLDAANREALNNLGLAYLQLGWPQRAEQFWKEAIQSDPRYVTAYKNLASLHYASHRYREAAGYYEKVLELRPHDWQAYLNLGNSRWRLEELPEAERLYNQALEKNPRATQALNNLAAVLAAQGKSDEAVPLLRRAIALDGDYLDARMNLAQILFKQSRFDEASSQLKELRRLDQQAVFRRRIEELATQLRMRQTSK